ncbi:cation transport protein-domain-containing protein [Aspergillus pseudodeflectus]|uniref:Cation transport protein-domain-containing protein n=1 Tax=Aspergillus pseudodeflectus TaxID=176178 RepID=A0ABR4JA35_9EURO
MISIILPFNYITVHYIYFVATSLTISLIFWGLSNPLRISYVDSLFMCVSAITGAGLNTVEASTLSISQQIILFLLLMAGHTILISVTVLHVRKRAFQHKFRAHSNALTRRPAHDISMSDLEVVPSFCESNKLEGFSSHVAPTEFLSCLTNNANLVSTDIVGQDAMHGQQGSLLPDGSLEGQSGRNRDSYFPINKPDPLRLSTRFLGVTLKYFQPKGHLIRRSQIHKSSFEERKKILGSEYKAVSFLSVLIPLYWLLFVCLGALGMGSWLQFRNPQVARENRLSPFWVGAFFAVSAFVNSGMSILDANMSALQTEAIPLIFMGILILAGNTLYPCILRFIVWSFRRAIPDRPEWESWRATLDFILDHPRRVYTNLFPTCHTWYLLGTVIVLNGLNWASFEILSLGNREVEALPMGFRILDGLSQALAVRTGGFSIVTIAELKQGLLFLYGRHTNVYDERSLRIYAADAVYNQQSTQSMFMILLRHHLLAKKGTFRDFVREQLRDQLTHDLWWLALSVLLISIIESRNYTLDPVGYSTFNILFEVVSTYSCVGISIGYPGGNRSFRGVWHSPSKLILAVVALHGRHRGLPVAIDKAVMLPNESLAWLKEDAASKNEQSLNVTSGPGAV